MQQFLKTGSSVCGEKGTYRVDRTESVSNAGTGVSYLCTGADGKTYRMRHYQSESPSLGEPRSKLLAMPAVPGISRAVDHGEHFGLPFDLFPSAGDSLETVNIGMADLWRCVIPQIGYGLACAHASGLLIRDISPKTIRFDPAARTAVLEGFDELAVLGGGATATGAESRGIEPVFYPPEYETMGWSIYSDFYAFGITLFLCMKGQDIYRGMTNQQIRERAKKWALPGVDRAALCATPFEMRGAEQRLMYLVLGLTNPDPRDRWGYAELRCWCAGQDIPLVQSPPKVRYQMYIPFIVGQERCWDYPQLAMAMAKNGAMSTSLLPALKKHLDTQNAAAGQRVGMILANRSLSDDGKLFYTVYTLYPNMSGLWWKGRCYRDSEHLVQAARDEHVKGELHRMLVDGCFSFLTTLRGANKPQAQKLLAEYQQLERYEREQTGKGVSRFFMELGGQNAQRFRLGSREYATLDELLRDYEKRGGELVRQSGTLLRDQMFKSWLWVKGYGAGADALAAKASDNGEAFRALLGLCEKLCTPAGVKACRRLYLRWGPYAPVTWLKHHTTLYEDENDGPNSALRRFAGARWSEDCSLDDLDRRASDLLLEYQGIVRQTKKNPLERVSGMEVSVYMPITPICAEAYFCCKWRSHEVTPAFLIEMGEKPAAAQIGEWADQALSEVTQKIEAETTKIRAVKGFSDSETDTVSVETQVGCLVAWFALIVIAAGFGAMNSSLPGLVILFAVIALWFPVRGLLRCYKFRADDRYRSTTLGELKGQLESLGRRGTLARQYRNSIVSALPAGKSVALPKEHIFQASADSIDVTKGSASMNDTLSLVSLATTHFFTAVLPFAGRDNTVATISTGVLCLVASLIFKPADMLCSGLFGRALLIQIASLILCVLFHEYMLLALLIGGVVIAIIINGF